ncbi:MAG: HPF/RaiA family ribosome-associated protein [Candidatus Yonathbacteria bacterium]|nr:HPF/RaiA family ribosome-associated protein [Candidatus Yonathbacteria bacterium]
MNIEYYFKNCTGAEKEQARAYVETKRAQLEKLILERDHASTALEAKIERLVKKHAYKVTFMLRWPHEDLYAFEDDHTIAEAIDFAKDKLVEQIKKTYDHLRARSSPHHTSVSPKEWDMIDDWVSERPQITREAFMERVEPLLAALKRHLTREIGYAIMEGAIPPKAIRPEGVIADTLVDVHAGLDDRPEGLTLEHWFFQRALEVLKEQIRALQVDRASRVSLERQLPEAESDKTIAGTIEEKIDMWQPDDDLKFEQFVANEQWFDPGEAQSHEELLRDLSAWVRVLPEAWRQVLLLHVLQGFSFDAIAKIQNRMPSAVEKDLASAKQYLKEQLQA